MIKLLKEMKKDFSEMGAMEKQLVFWLIWLFIWIPAGDSEGVGFLIVIANIFSALAGIGGTVLYAYHKTKNENEAKK